MLRVLLENLFVSQQIRKFQTTQYCVYKTALFNSNDEILTSWKDKREETVKLLNIWSLNGSTNGRTR